MSPLVIKVGGAVLEQDQLLSNLLQGLKGLNRPWLLVHGGGVVIEQLLSGLGMTSSKVDGLRVTPAEQIPYVTGALAGTSNKLLLASCLKHGYSALGLCLGDAGICKVAPFDARLGHVAAAEPGNPQLLKLLLSQNYLPVVSSIGVGQDGLLYNVNADQAAVAIAQSLNAQLVLLSDVPGVLDGDKALIASLNQQQSQQLIADGVITDGMAVKVNAALDAAQTLGQQVLLASWQQPELLADFLSGTAATDSAAGTLVG
ncbi:acetylglutamate kinase [Aliagarivorans marinus]|uniref:acetylglutamate kinase n=1 Tax=Aliagarivorans marinus TaxID=561965 RepID=UPI00040F8B63|nr:acetylglutamate kinase [Aliagarivorans marinus]